MKRIISFVTCMVALCGHWRAEGRELRTYNTNDILPKVTMSVKVGLQAQYLSGNTLWNKTYNTGPLAGLCFSVHRNMFGGRVEANGRSIKYSHDTYGTEVNIVNLDIPVLFEFRPIKELAILVGGQGSLFPRVQDRSGKDVSRFFSSQEASFVIGAEGILPLRLIAGARFIKGITDINDTSRPGTWTTTGAQFYVGYRFVD
ncbi:hypothetical protein [Nemorincola caseinilytica]